VNLAIPGRFNQTNAVLAAAAAEAMGVPAGHALRAMSTLSTVAGRFSVRSVGGVPARLMLAKNPAGWHELLALVCPGTGPVVVAINARLADGRDPSWLWDVEFEKLAGRPVVAAGERCRDLSVRLRYAEVDHEVVRDSSRAVPAARRAATGQDARPVDFIGNYTAFNDLVRAT
jgi:UDP-N-acetylmuramyl tripeptide synthase